MIMYNQIKLKLELIDLESKIQETLRFWLMQLTCVVNRAALVGASSLVDPTNAMLTEVCVSEQFEESS